MRTLRKKVPTLLAVGVVRLVVPTPRPDGFEATIVFDALTVIVTSCCAGNSVAAGSSGIIRSCVLLASIRAIRVISEVGKTFSMCSIKTCVIRNGRMD